MLRISQNIYRDILIALEINQEQNRTKQNSISSTICRQKISICIQSLIQFIIQLFKYSNKILINERQKCLKLKESDFDNKNIYILLVFI